MKFFTKEQIKYLRSIGLKINFDVPSDEELQLVENAIEDKLMLVGFEEGYKINSEGKMCESIIDKLDDDSFDYVIDGMINTPFGRIGVSLDGEPIEYDAVKLPANGRSLYSRSFVRYAIPLSVKPDGKKHIISCRVINPVRGTEISPQSDERMESVFLQNTDNTVNMSIACEGETWEIGDVSKSSENGYDYDTVNLKRGMQYVIMPGTKTENYVFGICWNEGLIAEQEYCTDTGADPGLYNDEDFAAIKDYFDDKYQDVHYCPNCGAILEEQDGFDPELPCLACKKCGKQLVGDDLVSDVFGDVVWYCDKCGSILNRQYGFTEKLDNWQCRVCGHINKINKDEIIETSDFA